MFGVVFHELIDPGTIFITSVLQIIVLGAIAIIPGMSIFSSEFDRDGYRIFSIQGILFVCGSFIFALWPIMSCVGDVTCQMGDSFVGNWAVIGTIYFVILSLAIGVAWFSAPAEDNMPEGLRFLAMIVRHPAHAKARRGVRGGEFDARQFAEDLKKKPGSTWRRFLDTWNAKHEAEAMRAAAFRYEEEVTVSEEEIEAEAEWTRAQTELAEAAQRLDEARARAAEAADWRKSWKRGRADDRQ